MEGAKFLCYQESHYGLVVELVFYRQNIWCQIDADPITRIGKPWWIDTTTWIAQLQLDKVDQYLAQHPGAS